MIETFREFTFEAAHQLPPYSGLHGHSFKVQVVFVGDPNPVYGWATSLTDIDDHIDRLQEELDEKYLNDISGLEVPSLENISRWIFDRLAKSVPNIDRIVLSRGAGGRAEGCTYRPIPAAARTAIAS